MSIRPVCYLLWSFALLLGNATTFAADRPNIIVILSDDMGFSDIGCYGGEIQTPVLDALAKDGLRFTQFYNTARCCPTRASLLTGLYPHQASVGHMMEDKGIDGYRGDLSPATTTMAEVLRSSGYGTYAVGKWHVTHHVSPQGPKHNWPIQRGFDRFYGTIKGGGSFYDPTALCRDNTYITPENDPDYKPAKFYYTDAISDNAVTFLQQHRKQKADQPLFMYVAYTAAHWPMHALPEDIAKYKGKYDAGYAAIRAARYERVKQLGLVPSQTELSPADENWDEVQHREWEIRCMEVYAAMIDRMDQGIGRIVAELKVQGQLDNTLILYMQDNGGCAEGVGRQSNADKIRDMVYQKMAPDQLQHAGNLPMQTRDGRPVRAGPEAMPGPEDTFIAYGRGWANVSNTPLREYKHWVHEGGISTPLVAHWPTGIAAEQRGSLVHEPGHLIDIMATCIDLSDAKYPESEGGHSIPKPEGVSLLPAFEGKGLAREQPIFWEHEGNRAVRDGRWKLVAKGPAGAWELYDIEADRSEMHNLAAEQPVRVQTMTEQWETWAHRAKALPWIWKPQYGEAATSDDAPKQPRKGKKKRKAAA